MAAKPTLSRWALGPVFLMVSALSLFVVGVAPAHAAAPSGWNIVTSPNAGSSVNNLLLGSTCVNAWDCWAVGGNFQNFNTGFPLSALIAHWDGSSWSLVNPNNSQTAAFGDVACVTSSDCWAVGAVNSPARDSPMAEHWNGASWSSVPMAPGVDGFLDSLTCPSTTDCWAVGSTQAGISSPVGSLMEHWDGSSWTLVPPVPNGQAFSSLNGVTCVSDSDCWAVGNAGPNQQQPNFIPILPAGAPDDQGLIEHWNGSSWSLAPSPAAPSPNGSYLGGVTCITSTSCWAVGTTTDASGTVGTTLVELWNGTVWSDVPSPTPAQTTGLLAHVTCLSASACWAVGAQGLTGGHNSFDPTALIENWNGSSWSIDPSPNVTALSFLDGVACVAGTACWAVGFSANSLTGNGGGVNLQNLIEQMEFPPPSVQGMWMGASDGGVFAFGRAGFYGSMGGQMLNQPVVGMGATPDGGGYWLVARDGGVFAFGDASFDGSFGGHPLNAPVVGMASTPDGRGYWLVAADGGVFAFGDAAFYGSMGGKTLNAPVVAMASTSDGGGYWLVASDGGVFAFGDAAFRGSMGGQHLAAPITGLSSTPDGGGYWVAASDGGVFSFGDASFYGSVPGQGIVRHAPIVGIAVTRDGGGYWLSGTDGSLYAYGDATFMGSLAGIPLVAPVIGAATAG
jgi:hypothetical protein